MTAFQGFARLEENSALAGYAALIEAHDLRVPLPASLAAIGVRHRKEVLQRWQIFTPRHRPEDSLFGHLTFALKYEGIDLGVLKALFTRIDAREITALVQREPTGRYSRRLWFLYEWLCDTQLDLVDATKGSYVDLVDSSLQFSGTTKNSRRHRVRNNLPGTPDFCPMIRRTAKLEHLMSLDLAATVRDHIGTTHADLVSRAAAFLLLKDSKASFAIEGESPPQARLARWGRIVSQAGSRPVTIEQLEMLQREVIEDFRFVVKGLRGDGGFVGGHDRLTGQPLPDHISARPNDLKGLLGGMIEAYESNKGDDIDAVLLAAMVGFAFVFIHPFADGNGRIHRYLIHHVLADCGFVPKGLVFPISAVILDRVDQYRAVLESFSKPRLDLIEWRPTPDNNVEVLNETIDLYRYFDCTEQAEFLYECVEETVLHTLPDELAFLQRYDQMQRFINEYLEMPARTIDLLIRFLAQNEGRLSRRAKEKEFAELTAEEVSAVEQKYAEVFL